MDKNSILFAKITALHKSLKEVDLSSGRIVGSIVDHLFKQYERYTSDLRAYLPELYSDLPEIDAPSPYGTSAGENIYNSHQIKPLLQNLDYIIEVRTNSRIGERIENAERSKRIFISHGRSNDWYKVQAHVERDLEFKTLELAQEPILGRTILQKLNEESNRCGLAIIVMTGDDIFEDVVRARENVMHEIGFFQGKYGLEYVILLHEEGVNIPTNIAGLNYIPFPKGSIETTFGTLFRELKVLTSI